MTGTAREHNQRVRQLAERMPTPTLANAIRAIGYRADWQTGITSGWTGEELAKQSRKQLDGRYALSERSLWRALRIFRDNGVVTVTARKVRGDGKIHNGRSDYALNLDWQGTLEMGRRSRRRERESAKSDEAERMASLTEWDDQEPAEDSGTSRPLAAKAAEDTLAHTGEPGWQCPACRAFPPSKGNEMHRAHWDATGSG
jgi:hypothetical protein